MARSETETPDVATGAERLAHSSFAALDGKRVGLITNQTGLVGRRHLTDLMHAATKMKLATIFAPEHGFRGLTEAGTTVDDSHDPYTGVKVLSLYGATREPTKGMLAGLDALVFDIQDIGVRFYTYISTMGLAMQAAATIGVPFIVLDRPNPLGGDDISGFVLEPVHKSFIGQYPIPVVHGMTTGELALMIKGESWLPGLEKLDLQTVEIRGWKRHMRWPVTGLAWVATSPNIPTFKAALAYPGLAMVSGLIVNEGRGTSTPFLQFGTPWLNAGNAVDALNAQGLPGVSFEATSYTPRSIPSVADDPRFCDETIQGVRLTITDIASYRPLEVGMHALAYLHSTASTAGAPLYGKLPMFHALAGTKRLHTMLLSGAGGRAIVASWADEVSRFRRQRQKYLLY